MIVSISAVLPPRHAAGCQGRPSNGLVDYGTYRAIIPRQDVSLPPLSIAGGRERTSRASHDLEREREQLEGVIGKAMTRFLRIIVTIISLLNTEPSGINSSQGLVYIAL